MEALTYAVEVLTQRQNSHDDNLDRLFDVQNKHEAKLDCLFGLQAKNELALADLMESVNSWPASRMHTSMASPSLKICSSRY